MKEYPRLLKPGLAQQVYDGTKTQTRAPWVGVPSKFGRGAWAETNGVLWALRVAHEDDTYPIVGKRGPFGKIGDRIWIRETWRPVMESWTSFIEFAGGIGTTDNVGRELYRPLTKIALRFSGANRERQSEAWHPSIHMPRWAARSVCEIGEVRVQLVDDITLEDAQAEGFASIADFLAWWHKQYPGVLWCFAYTFRRIKEAPVQTSAEAF